MLEIFCFEIIWRVCFKALSNKVGIIGTCLNKCPSYCNISLHCYVISLTTYFIDSANNAVQIDVKLIPLLDINECESNPCQNGATCRDLVGGYVCSCGGGYTGPNCEGGKTVSFFCRF